MFAKWFLLAVLAGIFSTVFNTINRTHLKENEDSTAYSWWFEFLRMLVFGVFAVFNFQMTFSWQSFALLISLGLSEFVAVYYFMKMHAVVELSVSSVITQFRVILVPILAYLFIGERLSTSTYLSIILLLCGLILTVTKIQFSKNKRGVQYAILFACTSAVSSILMKQASGIASVPVVMFFFSLGSVILFPMLMKGALSRLKYFMSQHSQTVVMATIANTMTLFLLGAAYKVGNVSQITAIFLSMFIGNVIVGTVFLHEKFSKRQFIGVIIVLMSIFLLR